MTRTLNTVDIKGKPYVLVNERMKFFRETYPEYSLITQILELNDGIVTMKAEISDPTGRVIAVGHAQEKETSSFINKTSYIENCETSAWGRALANFGIGIDESIASFDEVQTAILNQNAMKENTRKIEKEAADSFQEVMNKVPMATDEQISRIKNLLFALQQPEDAVLEKNNIKSFKEFTEKAADSLIAKLKDRVNKDVV